MKLLFITPGSGDNFYCENCMRDRELVKALAQTGVDVVFMPLYLPVELEVSENKDDAVRVRKCPLFFGGINAWLDQNLPGWSKMPAIFRNCLDSSKLLRLAGRSSVAMTNPSKLGAMTLSMLEGKDGRQSRQLAELIHWLTIAENRPDAVILSNALLAGIAPELTELPTDAGGRKVAVFCLLQDEDAFLDSLGKYAADCWQQLRQNSRFVTKYIAVSDFYAQLMQKRMGLPDEKMAMCYSGVNFADYAELDHKKGGPPVIGYLSRICPANGFDLLVRGFIALRRREGFADARLIVSGGEIGARAFIAEQKKRLAEANALDAVEFRPEFRLLHDRLSFFSDIDVLCVPQRGQVAHGRFCLESFAAGVPVIVPDSGVYPELINSVGEGVLCNQEQIEALDEVLANFFVQNRTAPAEIQARAREKYDIGANALELLRIIERSVESE